jgi:hypothetical protein
MPYTPDSFPAGRGEEEKNKYSDAQRRDICFSLNLFVRDPKDGEGPVENIKLKKADKQRLPRQDVQTQAMVL